MPNLAIYGSCFWGFNEPGCFLWSRVDASGRVYIVKDYKFIRKPVEVVAHEIIARTKAIGVSRFASIYADPEMFAKPTKESKSLEAEAPAQSFSRHGLSMVPSGSNIVHGWSRVHDYLRDGPDGLPWLVIDPQCQSLVRTLPSLVQATNDPDDCDGDLYAAHALRILLSARPSPSSIVQAKKPFEWGTVGWLKQREEPTRRGVLAR